jgi:hypothetical protein
MNEHNVQITQIPWSKVEDDGAGKQWQDGQSESRAIDS